MNEVLVDTNVWLRYFLQDDVEQCRTIGKVIKKIKKGELKLVLLNEVVLEVSHVLESFYKLDKNSLAKMFLDLILVRGIVTESVWVTVFMEYPQGKLSLVDMFLKNLTLVKEQKLFTFDKKLAKSLGVRYLYEN